MDAPLPKPPTDDAKPPAPPKEDRPIGPWGGEPMPADPDKDEDWPAPGPEIPAPYQDQRPDPEVFGGPDPGAPPPNPNPQTFEKPRFMCNALDDAEAEMRKLWAWRERRKGGRLRPCLRCCAPCAAVRAKSELAISCQSCLQAFPEACVPSRC